MTVPWMMNCPHSEDSWCLECTHGLGSENWKLRDELRAIKDRDPRLKLAEAYDAVAYDLSYKAQEFGRIAAFCEQASFEICERKISDEMSAERAADTSKAAT